MKFRRMEKRKIYPTWISTRKLNGCNAYVFQVLDKEFYHFQIACDEDIQYSSLVDQIKFSDFEECCTAAEQWIRNN